MPTCGRFVDTALLGVARLLVVARVRGYLDKIGER